MAWRRWQARVPIASLVVVAGVALLAQACGGGSSGENVTPTATTPLTSATGGGAPETGDITPGARPQGLFVGGASEEFAAFLDISLEQLESELNAERATPASVAEAHGRTREELRTFFIEQLQANLSEAVVAGTMSQEAADSMFERQAARIDDFVEGNLPSDAPWLPADGR